MPRRSGSTEARPSPSRESREIEPRDDVEVKVTRGDGSQSSFTARCRIDTYNELEYFRAGGILHYVLRRLAA